MADGYKVYDALSREPGGFTLANCWAHVRRAYLGVEQAFPAQSKEILDLIGELHAVDRLRPTGPPWRRTASDSRRTSGHLGEAIPPSSRLRLASGNDGTRHLVADEPSGSRQAWMPSRSTPMSPSTMPRTRSAPPGSGKDAASVCSRPMESL